MLGKNDFARQLYVPRNSSSPAINAAFVVWNILNAVAREKEPLYRYQQGHVRPIQATVLLEEAGGKASYCEFGFNAGHSAALILVSDPAVTIHSFDLMSFNYSWPVAHLLNESFGQRLRILTGPSGNTLRHICERRKEERPKCDIVFVDGSHRRSQVLSDLALTAKCITKPGTVFVVDDTTTGSGAALQHVVNKRLFRRKSTYGPYPPRHVNNPCMQTPQGKLCFPWGFDVAVQLA